MTLNQLRKDKRISKINICDESDFPEGYKYEIWLEDGYMFDWEIGVAYTSTVKDIEDLLDCIVERK